jgi:hypothetical protein
MRDQNLRVIKNALSLADATACQKLFLFLSSRPHVRWFLKSRHLLHGPLVLVIPKDLEVSGIGLKQAQVPVIRNWSGNQTRFSRIKYAFLHGVLQGIISTDCRVICVLGPSGKPHLDTITIHDLAHSWSEDFPFEARALIKNPAFPIIMATIDVALDIGALGREGRSIGTTFVIGDEKNVLETSHQLVFNPFKGYPKRERLITRPEVVESIKELAQLDGAIIIAADGTVEAAGRHLDAERVSTKRLRGLGSRHRSAAGITRRTSAVAVVVSESTGTVTIFERGVVVTTLEPLISRRVI